MTYELIQVRTEADKVGIVTLNRPKQLNALNDQLMNELGQRSRPSTPTRPSAAWSSPAAKRPLPPVPTSAPWPATALPTSTRATTSRATGKQIRSIRKPVIAAVSGFALGGGCELAMMCDFIIAADNAKFGQPEIKLGIIPGAGGTQRLPRAVGKAKAMDMALTGRMMDAAEAERAGLVSRVVALDKLMDETLAAALMICDYSQVAVMAAKESVNRAFEGTLERWRDVRAPPVPRPVRHGRPERGHGRLRGQAQARISPPVTERPKLTL